MLRFYPDSDDTLIVEDSRRPPLKVIEREGMEDLVLADFVLYDDELFAVETAVYAVVGSPLRVVTRWDKDGYRTFEIAGRIPSGWDIQYVDRVNERCEDREPLIQLNITGPKEGTEVRRIKTTYEEE